MALEPTVIGTLLMVVMSIASFLLGRWLSRGWRARRRAKEIAAARAQESRQQRRARERREGPR